MSWTVFQTKRFTRIYKKLHDNVAISVDEAIDIIVNSPKIGEKKKGDLADLYVYKFRSQGQLYLLGYTLSERVEIIYLESVGSHENFYRDLKGL
jgi:mRNA-degrading endonuclease RelE of RelBE toxin-antitoxin system